MIELDHLNIALTGMNLIEASAGTGKTYAIACLYLRLLIEKRLPPEQILVVTYTEAATKELRGRIRARIREALSVLDGAASEDPFLVGLREKTGRGVNAGSEAGDLLNRALTSFDTAAIFTIHGFCLRALQDSAFESGSLYDTELVTDPTPLVREIVEDFWRTRFFGEPAPLLVYALRNGYDCDYFMKFIREVSTNPLRKIIPWYDAAEIEAMERDCLAIFGTLRDFWRGSGAEIREIITSDKGLRRSVDTYRQDLLPGLFNSMDLFVEGDNPYEIFSGFNRFTASGIAAGTRKDKVAPHHGFFDRCQRLLELVNRRFLALKSELVSFCREQLPLRKRERNIRFFDDLLNDLHFALCAENGPALAATLREKYRAALIDEFQDTDPVQYDIFRKIYAATDSPLFLIGDPKQAIYSFRGADIFAYLQAASDAPPDKRFTLTSNWRSTPRLLTAFNTIFTAGSQPFLYDQISYHPVSAARSESGKAFTIAGEDGSGLQVWCLPAGDDAKPLTVGGANRLIPAAVASEIVRLLKPDDAKPVMIEGRPLEPRDIAVIVRSHRQAGLIREALGNLGIPGVMRSDMTIFASDEARQVLTLLRALADPGNESRVRAAMVTDIMGRNGNDIALLNGDEIAWEECLELFREHHRIWLERGFMVMGRSLMEREGIRGRLLRYPDGERRLTNLLHCFELIHQAAHGRGSGVEGALTWFGERIAGSNASEEYQIRLETDDDAVRIVTVHVSKGLEYPVVFCPFLWGGVRNDDGIAGFHDGYDMVMDYGSPDLQRHRALAGKELLAENLRLFYVALTRARYRCYLCAGKIVDRTGKNRPETSPLSYLLHAAPAIGNREDPVAGLAGEVSALDNAHMLKQLNDVAARSRGSVTVTVMQDTIEAIPGFTGSGEPKATVCRTFEGIIAGDWRVSSFTSFAAHGKGQAELPDRDETDGEGETAGAGVGELPGERSILTFPRGARAGIFLHGIFEKLDFSHPEPGTMSSLVAEGLAKHGYDAAWLPQVLRMVDDVIATPLISPEGVFTLSELEPGSWSPEFEFLFPLRFVTPELLGKCLMKPGARETAVDLGRVRDSLGFKPTRGMVRGFIDMVFRHGGRYYLVDWKSNHLGYRPEDYCGDTLRRAMERNLYPLQYLLYTVALNRYLSLRVRNYDYATHFGGVLYMFLRGVSPEHGERYGIYRDLPPRELVDDLTNCLMEAGG